MGRALAGGEEKQVSVRAKLRKRARPERRYKIEFRLDGELAAQASARVRLRRSD